MLTDTTLQRTLRAVQLLLGSTELESTVRFLGIEVDNALEMAEQAEDQVTLGVCIISGRKPAMARTKKVASMGHLSSFCDARNRPPVTTLIL